MKKDREEKTKFSKILSNNQTITAYHIEVRVQEMTMKEKLTMIGLTTYTPSSVTVVEKPFLQFVCYCSGFPTGVENMGGRGGSSKFNGGGLS